MSMSDLISILGEIEVSETKCLSIFFLGFMTLMVGFQAEILHERSLREDEKQWKFAVPSKGACKELVQARYNSKHETVFFGYAIYVFEEVVKSLHLNYSYEPFNGTYDDMVKAVSNERYDGAVGDITVFAERLDYVDFTQPYLNSEVMMVVPNNPMKWTRLWELLNPFTWRMWSALLAMHLFVSATIWAIERGGNVELRILGDVLWFSVAVIFYFYREPIRKNMARFVLAPWLFSILIFTACFTASLTANMTASGINPSILTIDEARTSNVGIGCNQNSFLGDYLVNVLKFNPDNITRKTSIDDYPEAFKSGEIGAVFLLAPHAKVLLAKNCDDYVVSTSFGIGGMAFVRGTQLDLKPFVGLFFGTGVFAIVAWALILLEYGLTRIGWINKTSKQKRKSSALRRKLRPVRLFSGKHFRTHRFDEEDRFK